MKAIAATDKFWGIGKDNQLLFHIPEDLKFFKQQTEGKVVLMGRKTFESLPGGNPLPNRINVVLTNSGSFTTNGVSLFMGNCVDVEPILSKYDPDDIYVIGGGSIYKRFLHECDEIFITRYDKAYKPDTFFPNLYRENYQMSEVVKSGTHDDAEYQICRFTNAGEEPFYKMTGTYMDRNNGIHKYIISTDGTTFMSTHGYEYDDEFMRNYIKALYNSWEDFHIDHNENKVQNGVWRYQRRAVNDSKGIYCSMETYGCDIDECSDNSIRMCDYLQRVYLENNTKLPLKSII